MPTQIKVFLSIYAPPYGPPESSATICGLVPIGKTGFSAAVADLLHPQPPEVPAEGDAGVTPTAPDVPLAAPESENDPPFFWYHQ